VSAAVSEVAVSETIRPVIADLVITDPVITDLVIADMVIADLAITDPVTDPAITDPVTDPVITDPVRRFHPDRLPQHMPPHSRLATPEQVTTTIMFRQVCFDVKQEGPLKPMCDRQGGAG
jgi:hypothetical protein